MAAAQLLFRGLPVSSSYPPLPGWSLRAMFETICTHTARVGEGLFDGGPEQQAFPGDGGRDGIAGSRSQGEDAIFRAVVGIV